MGAKSAIKKILPKAVVERLSEVRQRRLWARDGTDLKHREETRFWVNWVAEHGSAPETEYYRKFMVAMGGLDDDRLFHDKICIDIGCGPRGSMTWLDGIAKSAVGVDPLVEQYMQLGIERHPMLYLKAGSENLPFPSKYADVVFSMNSLDHVDDLAAACREIRRVLKPGGYFIASLNLGEPPSPTEPWTLDPLSLDRMLFTGWTAEYREVRPKIDSDAHFGPYRYFFEPCPPEVAARPGPQVMWCRYRAGDPPRE